MSLHIQIVIRYLAFSLVYSPIAGSIIGTIAAYQLFKSEYLAWTWGISMGFPVGICLGLLFGLLPARGFFFLFCVCVTATTTIGVYLASLVQDVVLLLPCASLAYGVGVFIYVIFSDRIIHKK